MVSSIFLFFFYPPGFFHNLTCVSLLFHHLDTLFQPPTYTVDQGKVHLPISIFAEKVPSQYYSEAIHKKKTSETVVSIETQAKWKFQVTSSWDHVLWKFRHSQRITKNLVHACPLEFKYDSNVHCYPNVQEPIVRWKINEWLLTRSSFSSDKILLAEETGIVKKVEFFSGR